MPYPHDNLQKIAPQSITTNFKINPMNLPFKTTYKNLEKCNLINQVLDLFF
jgi:hypothetical protein